MKRIRVAVIDDHSVVRMGLKFTVRLFKERTLTSWANTTAAQVPRISLRA